MRYLVQPEFRKSIISREIYGNFAEHLGRCIYDGVYVGEESPIPNRKGMRTDIVEALKAIRLPVLRWPGGCFADEYHWMDGIGPKERRKRIVNSNWGGVVEDNRFGTHEFMELCGQIGCQPYVNGNLGSGTVQEMQQWVEYITCPDESPMANLRAQNGRAQPWSLKYFGVGNENWGCGGSMRPEFYADQYRRYQTFVRNYGQNRIYKICCGPGASEEAPNYEWTEVMMKQAAGMMDGLSLHYYTLPTGNWSKKGSATAFGASEYYDTLRHALFMETLIRGHGAIMDRYDPKKRIGLMVDEWGTWYDVEEGTNPHFLYQQNTMRDAMVAAATLNIFNHHSDRVKMANIAQLVNVLQALALTDGEKMLLTPTYYIFDLFKEHQGATLVESTIHTGRAAQGVPQVSESASVDKDGRLVLTMANLSLDQGAPIELLIDQAAMKFENGEILTGQAQAHNTFEAPDNLKNRPFEAVKCSRRADETRAEFVLPPCSAVRLSFSK